jgi:hypothetical protein
VTPRRESRSEHSSSPGLPTATIRRPFHWGIVIIVAQDWIGDLPAVDPGIPVSANEGAVIILVRHAQDSDQFEGELMKFAEVEVTVRKLDQLPAADDSRREVFRGSITAPTGHITVGDADDWLVVPAHRGANTIAVSVDAQVSRDDLSPEAVQIDFLAG